MTNWISVGERVPDLDQHVVVTNRETYYAGRFCNRPGFDRCIMNGKWFRGFTHWMPPPEPPEVKP